jgi:spore maturation protein CgeB
VVCTRHAAGLDPAWRADLLRRCSSALWYFDPGVPIAEPVLRLAREVTWTFATYGHVVTAFGRAGAAAAFLPQGMDPRLDRPADYVPNRYRTELVFIGSGQYPRRHPLLKRLAGEFQLQIRGPSWPGDAGLPVAGERVRGAAFAQAAGGAAVNLGIEALSIDSRQPDGGTSNRLWRVLGAGGCFLGEWVPGIESLARHDVHAMWFRSEDEAIDLARTLLGNPAHRRRLGETGRAHALARHTYQHRLALLLTGQGHTST